MKTHFNCCHRLTCALFLLSTSFILLSNGSKAQNNSLPLGEVKMASSMDSKAQSDSQSTSNSQINWNSSSFNRTASNTKLGLHGDESLENLETESDEAMDVETDGSALSMPFIEGKIIEIVPMTEKSDKSDKTVEHDLEPVADSISELSHLEPQTEDHYQIPEKSVLPSDLSPSNGNSDLTSPISVTESNGASNSNLKVNTPRTYDLRPDLTNGPSPSTVDNKPGKVNDLPTSANSVAVKVTEVKKKSLAAKMMDRLRKNEKDDEPDHHRSRPSRFLSEAKDLVYVNAGVDSKEKPNIIVVSNGGSGNGGMSHHHGSLPDSIPSQHIVPIFTPIHENHHDGPGEPHPNQFPIFHNNNGPGGPDQNGESVEHGGDMNLPSNLNDLGGPGPMENLNSHDMSNLPQISANLGPGNDAGGGGGWPENPGHGLSGSEDDQLRTPFSGVSSSVERSSLSSANRAARRLIGSGSNLNEQLLHPMSQEVSGETGSHSLSNVMEHLGLSENSGSSSSNNRGFNELIRSSLLNNQREDISSLFEPKSSLTDHDQRETNGLSVPGLKGFSLLSDAGNLANYRALLAQHGRVNDWSPTSSLLGSNNANNDRLLSLILEQQPKSIDLLGEHLHIPSAHGLTELSSAPKLGHSLLSAEEIGLEDALKRLTMIEMLNKKQIPLTATLLDELRGHPHTSGMAENPLSQLDSEIRKLKSLQNLQNLQQLHQIQQQIKKNQVQRAKPKISEIENGKDSEEDDAEQLRDTKNGRSNNGGANNSRRQRPRTKPFDALARLKEQRERFRERFRSAAAKTKAEEEEEEYEEAGVEHEGEESRGLVLRMLSKPLKPQTLTQFNGLDQLDQPGHMFQVRSINGQSSIAARNSMGLGNLMTSNLAPHQSLNNHNLQHQRHHHQLLHSHLPRSLQNLHQHHHFGGIDQVERMANNNNNNGCHNCCFGEKASKIRPEAIHAIKTILSNSRSV